MPEHKAILGESSAEVSLLQCIDPLTHYERFEEATADVLFGEYHKHCLVNPK